MKGQRIFTCDHCGKRETWRAGWGYLPGIESDANKDPAGELLFPASFCSPACSDAWLEAAHAARWAP